MTNRHQIRIFRSNSAVHQTGDEHIAMETPDYHLPEEAIAQVPVEPRDAARLLVALGPELRHKRVADLPDLLGEGDVLVVNSSRVVPARLRLRKETGGAAEVLLLEPRAEPHGSWEALVRPGRRLAPGTVLYAGRQPVIEVGERLSEGARVVRGLVDDLEPYGSLALPPYIHRPLTDQARYQTVYAERPGSVAAPTAGLHLTRGVLEECERRGVTLAHVDLAIGLGTFRPIKDQRVESHTMHAERYVVPASTWDACQRARRVIAVGTTTVRALESAGATGSLEGRTQLYIRPGHRFAVVDVLMTNFHQPRSTLLVMLEAFAGPRWRELYDVALQEGYRFLSFGDAMVVDNHVPH
ncbi:MAG TPA: tRNA preQ1(34) S-adenosylmethionine ribosyltransferase-isomerase QueA [Acidimicrobiales bacterium]|nr:tRNA preQ1(34) S-adenosylmethionine ribosyltransferase-isomerase QueA [Acidimicrobiales bacterium]